jgi:hypothetical protein
MRTSKESPTATCEGADAASRTLDGTGRERKATIRTLRVNISEAAICQRTAGERIGWGFLATNFGTKWGQFKSDEA